jgi:uncharacterized membrane protein YbhN (UPF0104 family)
MRAHLWTLCKIIFALAALGFVLSKIDFTQLWLAIARIPWWALLGAMMLLNLSCFFSAERTRVYLRARGIALSRRVGLQFYYKGMLYNTLLPGGVGGDGYKIWLLKKHHALPTKQGLQIMLADRGSGLLVLLLTIATMLPMSALYAQLPFAPWLLGAGMLATLAGYVLVGWRLTDEDARTSLIAAFYSAGVQLSACATAWVLAVGLGMEPLEYVLLFQIAAVVSIVPVTVGGVGLRELVFFIGAPLAGVAVEPGIGLSLLWFALYVLSSLGGLGKSGMNH